MTRAIMQKTGSLAAKQAENPPSAQRIRTFEIPSRILGSDLPVPNNFALVTLGRVCPIVEEPGLSGLFVPPNEEALRPWIHTI